MLPRVVGAEVKLKQGFDRRLDDGVMGLTGQGAGFRACPHLSQDGVLYRRKDPEDEFSINPREGRQSLVSMSCIPFARLGQPFL